MVDPLAKFQRRAAGTEIDLEMMRRAAWLGQGVLAVKPGDIVDVWLRQALINFAEVRYGKRQGNAAGQPGQPEQTNKPNQAREKKQ